MSQEPWLDNKHWAGNQIRSGSMSTVWILWIVTLLATPLGAVVGYFVLEEQAGGNHIALIGLAFPLAAVILFLFAIRATLRWIRIGPTPVTLDPFPGSIGGHVGGIVRTRLALRRGDPAHCTLRCTESYTTGSGEDRETHTETLWHDEGPGFVDDTPRGGSIRFRFDCPAGLPESNSRNRGTRSWSLGIELPAHGLSRSFTIPVYATARQSETISEDSGGAARDAAAADLLAGERDGEAAARLAKQHGLRLMRDGAWTRLYFRYGRHIGAAIGGVVFGLVFGGFGIGMRVLGDVPLIFPILFGGFGLLVILGALYGATNALDVRFHARKLVAIRRWLGLRVSRRELDPDMISSVELSGPSSASSSIRAKLRSGKTVTLAEGLRGRQAAVALRDLIAATLGVAASEAGTAAPPSGDAESRP